MQAGEATGGPANKVGQEGGWKGPVGKKVLWRKAGLPGDGAPLAERQGWIPGRRCRMHLPQWGLSLGTLPGEDSPLGSWAWPSGVGRAELTALPQWGPFTNFHT